MPADNQSFAEKLGLDYPILSDPGGAVAGAMGVLGLTGMAKRHTVYIGVDGKVLAVDDNVSVRTHGGDIARRLGELGVARR